MVMMIGDQDWRETEDG